MGQEKYRLVFRSPGNQWGVANWGGGAAERPSGRAAFDPSWMLRAGPDRATRDLGRDEVQAITSRNPPVFAPKEGNLATKI